MKRRAGEDQTVEQGDRDTDVCAAREVAQQIVAGGAVEKEIVADPGVGHRKDDRSMRGDEADVGHQGFVEDGVGQIAIEGATFALPSECGPAGRSERGAGVVGRHAAKAYMRPASLSSQ